MASLVKSASIGPNSFSSEVYEKKHNLRRIASEVGVMAADLQNARSRVAAQEAALQLETSRRQAAETSIKHLELQLEQLNKSFEESKVQAQSTANVAEQYLKELVEVRENLATAEGVAEASSAVATSAQLQCAALLKELDIKNCELEEHKNCISKLEQRIAELQLDLQQKVTSQKQLRYEVQDLETQIELTLAKSQAPKDCEFRILLDQISARNVEQLEKLLLAKDDDIAKLRKQLKAASAELRLKTLELETEVERQQKVDQELQKRVIKLEFWLQEARIHVRKLKKIAEKREDENQQLRAQLWLQEAETAACPNGPFHFLRNLRLPTFLSVSVIALLYIMRR